jgi:hypothetical protein
MNDYKAIVKAFGVAYIAYCKANGINMAKICRELKSPETGKRIPFTQQQLYNWKYGNIRFVYFDLMCALCREINMPVKYFLPD